MEAFLKKRMDLYQKKMMRYLKYVFNDHFLLVCMFLVGGLGLYYSNALKTLPADFAYGKVIVLVIWIAALSIGRLATFIQPADEVFLLPKESQMPVYFKKVWRHSLFLPGFLLFLFCGVSLPLLVATENIGFNYFFLFFPMLLFLKGAHLYSQISLLFQQEQPSEDPGRLFLWLGILLSLILSLFVHPIVGLLLSIFVIILEYRYTFRKFRAANLDWEKMVKTEQQRLHNIYRFINLFTDVPDISSSVKRRKMFDGVLNKIQKTQKNTYLYLYARSFIRGSEYSGLFFRLLLVSGVILAFLPDFWMALAVSLVFIYLIGFQLLPIYGQFDYMMMTQLYPVPMNQKKQAVGQLITLLLVIAGMILGLLVMIMMSDKASAILIVVALAVEIFLFVKFYLPYRLKKIEIY